MFYVLQTLFFLPYGKQLSGIAKKVMTIPNWVSGNDTDPKKLKRSSALPYT